MTKRAKIAAEHRDAVNDIKSLPDTASTGAKRARKKPRPWVVEYCAQKNSEKQWFLFKHDGVWHEYSGSGPYETERAALSAMRTFKLQQDSVTKLSRGTFARNLLWRVRDTRKEMPDAVVPQGAVSADLGSEPTLHEPVATHH